MMPTERDSSNGNADFSQGLLCVECEHLNPSGEQVCFKCGAHLYLFCDACGHRNERVYTSCRECKRPLHRSKWSRWVEKLLRKSHGLWVVSLGLAGLNFFRISNVSEAVTACVFRLG